jgi:hypothetical protein
MEPIPVSDLLYGAEKKGIEFFQNKLIAWIIAGTIGGIWLKLTLLVVNWVFKKYILPFAQDGNISIVCCINEVVLHKRVIVYEESTTDEEFDQAFSDLVSGPIVR